MRVLIVFCCLRALEHLGFDAITAWCIPGVALEGHYQIKACKTDSTATPILSCDKMYLDLLASSVTLICNDIFFDLLMIWMPEASLLRHLCNLTTLANPSASR